MKRGIVRAGAASSVLSLVPAALAGGVVVPGLAEDYHITLPEGTGAINTSNGIGMTASRLGVFGEDRDAPIGRPNAERRAIVEFDLAALLPHGDLVTAASFSIFLPNQSSGVPNRDLDLYGATVGRPAPIAFDTTGAADEFDAAGYTLLDAAFLEDITPLDYDTRFSTDVTAFIAARYAEFLADSSRRYVLFRMQVQDNGEGANAFYEISSAEAAAEEVPQLIVTVVPGPGVAWAMAGAFAWGLRRRRV